MSVLVPISRFTFDSMKTHACARTRKTCLPDRLNRGLAHVGKGHLALPVGQGDREGAVAGGGVTATGRVDRRRASPDSSGQKAAREEQKKS